MCSVLNAGLKRGEDLSKCVYTASFLSWSRAHNTNVFDRYYPSIRSCIECLLSMVDVNKCFTGEVVPLWPDTSPQARQLIKPPKDFLVCIWCTCNLYYFYVLLFRLNTANFLKAPFWRRATTGFWIWFRAASNRYASFPVINAHLCYRS